MMSYIARSGPTAATVMATKSFTPSLAKAAAAGPAPDIVEAAVYKLPPPPAAVTSRAMHAALAKQETKVVYGPGRPMQIRHAHTDIAVPDWAEIRRDSTRNPASSNKDTAPARKAFSYLAVVGAGAVGMIGGKRLVHGALGTFSASKDVLAMAKIEVDLGVIPEGKSVVMKWTGKPLFIRHRTDAEIETEKGVDMSTLRDPEHDDVRVKKDKWLVLIGVCTHLGCVPIGDAGDFGGYYCPCHGSHYDCAGRIRKGPAPYNLPVPPYEFTDETNIVVG